MLDSAVSDGVHRMSAKADFWGVGLPDTSANHTSAVKGFGENDIANLLEKIDPTKLTGDELALYGIGCEFVWGQPPPQEVQRQRHSLLQKVRDGQSLTPPEQLWFNLIQIDTDCF